jgi:curved DNA-binding protein CbpA
VPECGKLLGLTHPWTTDQVKQAFRCLVKKTHPDSGSDGEEFKKLYQSYEKALEMAVDRITA